MGKVVFGAQSEQLKLDGMASAAEHRKELLKVARQIAIGIALSRHSREVTADDVGRVLQAQYGIDSLGPAAGSIFKQSCWEFTGEWKKSKRITNHSRMLRVWRYKK